MCIINYYQNISLTSHNMSIYHIDLHKNIYWLYFSISTIYVFNNFKEFIQKGIYHSQKNLLLVK